MLAQLSVLKLTIKSKTEQMLFLRKVLTPALCEWLACKNVSNCVSLFFMTQPRFPDSWGWLDTYSIMSCSEKKKKVPNCLLTIWAMREAKGYGTCSLKIFFFYSCLSNWRRRSAINYLSLFNHTVTP